MNIRHTEKGCGYPESAHGVQAGLHTMAPEEYPVARKTTASVYSRQEKDITVICQHRIISGQDNFIRELLKPLSSNGKVFTGGKSPFSKAWDLTCICGLKRIIFRNGTFKSSINTGRHAADYRGVGTCHI